VTNGYSCRQEVCYTPQFTGGQWKVDLGLRTQDSPAAYFSTGRWNRTRCRCGPYHCRTDWTGSTGWDWPRPRVERGFRCHRISCPIVWFVLQRRVEKSNAFSYCWLAKGSKIIQIKSKHLYTKSTTNAANAKCYKMYDILQIAGWANNKSSEGPINLPYERYMYYI